MPFVPRIHHTRRPLAHKVPLITMPNEFNRRAAFPSKSRRQFSSPEDRQRQDSHVPGLFPRHHYSLFTNRTGSGDSLSNELQRICDDCSAMESRARPQKRQIVSSIGPDEKLLPENSIPLAYGTCLSSGNRSIGDRESCHVLFNIMLARCGAYTARLFLRERCDQACN